MLSEMPQNVVLCVQLTKEMYTAKEQLEVELTMTDFLFLVNLPLNHQNKSNCTLSPIHILFLRVKMLGPFAPMM